MFQTPCEPLPMREDGTTSWSTFPNGKFRVRKGGSVKQGGDGEFWWLLEKQLLDAEKGNGNN